MVEKEIKIIDRWIKDEFTFDDFLENEEEEKKKENEIKIYRQNKNVLKYNSAISLDPYLALNEDEKDKFINTLIHGGLSKDKDISKIPEDKIKQGIEVEMEHVDKDSIYAEAIAKKIACDHLFEDLNYYNKLAKIEK